MPTQQTKIEEIKLKQLVCPKPCPQRGKPFPLSGNDEWFIYPHGKSVYLYNLKDPKRSREYREHAYPVGVAKLSPSGSSIASGDQNGNLHIFNLLDSDDFKTKLEVRALAGRINDLSWSEDEKFVAVSGEGREQFANVIKVDGGASFGELTGPIKPSSSISLTSTHCFLASDDKSLTIYHAAPKFKFLKTFKDHEGFVQVVKCSEDGRMVASAGADGRVFIYSVDTLEVLLQCKLHDAGILAFEWCNNNQSFLTASADKTVKHWSFPTGQLICSSEISGEWTFEKQICGLKVVQGNKLFVLRLDGEIEVRSLSNLEQVNIPIFGSIGHSKGIVDLHRFNDKTLYSLSYDGSIKAWEYKNHTLNCTKESSFNTPIQKLITARIGAFEDKLKELGSTKTESLEIFGNNCNCKIVGYQGESRIVLSDGRLKLDDSIRTLPCGNVDIAIFSNISANNLAISTGSHLKILDIGINELYSEAITAKITAMAFSEDSAILAVADDQRRIKLYTRNLESNSFIKLPTQWCNHSARIDVLFWTRSGLLLSSGVDGCIMAWSPQHSNNRPVIIARNAHSAPISSLTEMMADEDGAVVIVSGASDSCIKVWEIQL